MYVNVKKQNFPINSQLRTEQKHCNSDDRASPWQHKRNRVSPNADKCLRIF